MSLETSRLRITGVTGGPLRITGASLVNGAYELATAGGADYELQTERQTTMDNILFIPGIANPVSEINQLLFGQGQQGTFIAPSLTASLISGSTFGTGVETLPDLSPRNNPFSQANSGNRGAWFREPKTGRRNLFIHTNDLSNPAWVKTNSTVLSSIDSPVANVDAWNVTGNAGTASKGVNQTASPILVAGEGRFWAKAGTQTIIQWRFFNDVVRYANFDLIAGTVAGFGTGNNATITDAGNGWFLCRVQTTDISTNGGSVQLVDDLSAARNATTASTGSFLVAGPQIGPIGPYQRVTTAFDVTEAGQRDCYGVRTDGTDDGYQTAGNVDFSGTDKVTVFAAVRKLSDANQNIIGYEPFVAKGFQLGVSDAVAGSYNMNMQTQTTTGGYSRRLSPFPAPHTGVIWAQFDRTTDTHAASFEARINGQTPTYTNAVTVVNNIGTFANQPLSLLRAGGVFFNGNLYALIVAGGSYPLSTIQRVERILSRITPTVNL